MSELNDIVMHKFSDSHLKTNEIYTEVVFFEVCDEKNRIGLRKDDSLVLANHFNLFDDYASVEKIKALIKKYENLDAQARYFGVNCLDLTSELEQLIE